MSLWTDAEQASPAGQAFGIPHRQIRPGFQQMATAGDEWQEEKTADLIAAFGPDCVLGHPSPAIKRDPSGGYKAVRYKLVELDRLLPGTVPGTFLIETELDPLNPVFEAHWRLDWARTLPLAFRRVRPDAIQVGPPSVRVRHHAGRRARRPYRGPTCHLAVIDMKLSSQPGPGYFAEVTYYSLAVAAWLAHNRLDGQYVVAAEAAVWPGSFDVSRVRAHGPSALDDDLELAPIEVFVSEISRFFREILPRVAATAATAAWSTDLAWHIVPSCAGCDYLGQTFPGVRGDPKAASQPHPNHCVPHARDTDHLCRLPFLPRGGTTVLARTGIARTAALRREPKPTDASTSITASVRGVPSSPRGPARSLVGRSASPART
ncbi:MAG: hypothetical protein ACRDZO_14755 [Egibacteraceae bacterium]